MKNLNSTVSGVPVVPALPVVSSFALFVQGDIRGGEHAHAFRMRAVRDAIKMAFQNTLPPIVEAMKLSDGKAKKSRAYHAGFSALMAIETEEDGKISKGIKAIKYRGKLSDPSNSAIREQIENATHHAFCAFESAFLPIWNQKPDKKVTSVPVAASVLPEATTGTAGNSATRAAAASVDVSMASVLLMVSTGLLTGAQLDELSEAIAAYKLASVPVEKIAPVELPVVSKAAKAKAAKAAKASEEKRTERSLAAIAAIKVDQSALMGLTHA